MTRSKSTYLSDWVGSSLTLKKYGVLIQLKSIKFGWGGQHI